MTGDTLGSVRQLAGTGAPPMLEARFSAVADLSLRDWFAGQALQAILPGALAGMMTDEEAVLQAWAYADKLLAVRAKEKPA